MVAVCSVLPVLRSDLNKFGVAGNIWRGFVVVSVVAVVVIAVAAAVVVKKQHYLTTAS